MNKILLTIAALVSSFIATAQVGGDASGVSQGEASKAYQQGKFTAGLLKGWGYHGYTYKDVERGLPGRVEGYQIRSKYEDWAEEQVYNKAFVGVEGGWFFLDDWKATLELGFSHTYRPGYPDKPAVGDEKQGGIPAYDAVANESATAYRLAVGVNRYFTFPSTPKLAFYGGAKLGIAHGIKAYNVDTLESQGVASAESFNFGLGLVSGIEYFFIPEMYAGIQISPISYSYNLTNIKPAPGLGSLGANAHNFSLIGAPTLKVGFIF